MLTRAPAPSGLFDRLGIAALDFAGDLYAKNAALLGAALFSLYMLLTAATVVVLPDANWDMLPYLAVAEEGTYPDPQALHDYVYGTVKAAVSESDWRALTDDGGGYRSHMAANAADFHSQLVMYRVKFVYAELLSAMSKVMSPVAAMQAIQVFSVLLFGAVTLLWLARQRLLALAPLAAGVLMALEFGAAARANSPDLLCAAVMLGALLAYVERREVPAAILLTLTVAIRPDNIVFAGVLFVLTATFRVRSAGVIAGFLASAIVYVAVSRWAGHPGWWPHLYFSSIEQQLNMDGFDPAFSVAAYAKAFVNAAVRAVGFNTWVGVAVLALGGWLAASRAGFGLDRRTGILFAALVLAVLAKFAVFPIHDTRIYLPNLFPPFLLIAVPLAALWRSAARNAGNRPDHLSTGGARP
ncbi:MAG TPA: hypothetical protein GX405_10285 [Rhizobiales bacterium]|nr:hypothetical protein [Hyphomicrobiales bacterium]